MEYTLPQSSPLSAPTGNPVETMRADHNPPSSSDNLKPSPPSLPAQGHLANTPGFFPVSPPASPGPAVDSLRGSSTPLIATPEHITRRADVASIKSNATLVDGASPPRSYSPREIEAAEILLMLYHGRQAPPQDPEETKSEEMKSEETKSEEKKSEEELAAKRLMELHAADKELAIKSKSQSGSVSQESQRRRIEPPVVTEPVMTRSGGR